MPTLEKWQEEIVSYTRKETRKKDTNQVAIQLEIQVLANIDFFSTWNFSKFLLILCLILLEKINDKFLRVTRKYINRSTFN